MKKIASISSVVVFLLVSGICQGQTKDSSTYFAGNWNMLLKGLPQGDTKLFVALEKKDSTYTGTILDSTKTEVAKISKVDAKGFTVTLYFFAQGYDVTLFMEKKDDDHVTGNMLNMFDALGERVREGK